MNFIIKTEIAGSSTILYLDIRSIVAVEIGELSTVWLNTGDKFNTYYGSKIRDLWMKFYEN